jgi:hypothetical protein
MQRKILKTLKSKKFVDIASKTKFWSPVMRDGWIIKFSVYDLDKILIFFVSQYTGQTIIRYFADENDAVKFINFICGKDPTEFHLEGDENPV